MSLVNARKPIGVTGRKPVSVMGEGSCLSADAASTATRVSVVVEVVIAADVGGGAVVGARTGTERVAEVVEAVVATTEGASESGGGGENGLTKVSGTGDNLRSLSSTSNPMSAKSVSENKFGIFGGIVHLNCLSWAARW